MDALNAGLTGSASGAGGPHSVRGRGRRRVRRAFLAGCVALADRARWREPEPPAVRAPAAAAPGPASAFAGSILGAPLVINVTPGRSST